HDPPPIFEYENGSIELIHHGEGRMVRSGGDYHYEYYMEDDLGNSRSGFAAGTNITAPNFSADYYPFGMQYQEYIRTGNPKNNYLYNGKELQDGLKLYDYGARLYDPVTGRWGTMDPLAENHHGYNPYNYVLNNPMFYMDPLGLDTVGYHGLTEDKWREFRTGEDIFKLDVVTIGTNRKPSAGSGGSGGGWIDNLQTTLDVAGIADPTGIADLTNAVIYVARGQLGNAAISAMGILPYVGDLGKAKRLGKKANDIYLAAKGVLKPLGLGSTGRTAAANLTEQLAMKEIMSNPTLGKTVMTGMKDSRWLGWNKMQYGTKTTIHYVGKFENGVLKAVDDFKFQ